MSNKYIINLAMARSLLRTKDRNQEFGTHADLEHTLDDPRRRDMRALYAHWLTHCDDGRPPGRETFDPMDFPRLLGNIFLLDVVNRDPLDLRFRVVGTRIAEIEGEMTGHLFSEIIPDRRRHATIWRQYSQALNGDLALRWGSLEWQGRNHVVYEVMLLPLRRTADAADCLLGYVRYLGPSEKSDIPAFAPRDGRARHCG